MITTDAQQTPGDDEDLNEGSGSTADAVEDDGTPVLDEEDLEENDLDEDEVEDIEWEEPKSGSK